jgi:hypothetical protein
MEQLFGPTPTTPSQPTEATPMETTPMETTPTETPEPTTPTPSTQGEALAPPSELTPPVQIPYESIVPPTRQELGSSSLEAAESQTLGCDESHALCQTLLEELRQKGLREISMDIALAGAEGKDFPCICPLSDEAYVPRNFACVTYEWKSASTCHKPLYFEEVDLERHGHTVPIVQPVISAAHFFGTLPVLPYCMGMDPPWECEYTLGHYRAGSCAPYVVPPFPFSLRGAVVQGAVTTGVIYAVP